jgi:hypothetical protein
MVGPPVVGVGADDRAAPPRVAPVASLVRADDVYLDVERDLAAAMARD